MKGLDPDATQRAGDERVRQYVSAVRAMQEGRFDWGAAVDAGDELGALGTELSKLAGVLRQRSAEAERLAQITEQVAGGLLFDDLLGRVFDAFRALIPYERMGCALLSEDSTRVTLAWARSEVGEMQLAVGYSAAMTSTGLTGALASGQPRVLNDLEAYLEQRPRSQATALMVAEGMRSSLACPLITQGKPVGFLFFSSASKDVYTEAHRAIFLRAAPPLSMLVENSRLYQQVYDMNLRLVFAQHQLREQATRDALTGLFNRGAILEQLDKELARSRRHGNPLAVMLVDVDHFKLINDQHGHQAGDLVLRAIARRLSTAVRRSDSVGRYGGEEFLALLPDASTEGAQFSAERLRTAVAQATMGFDGKNIAATVSLGVAVAPRPDGLTVDQLIRAADEELYTAKSTGRNRVGLRVLDSPAP